MSRSDVPHGRGGIVRTAAAFALLILLPLVGGAIGPSPWPDRADGFASVNALGQDGTTGGAGGRVVTVRTQADLERYAALPEPIVLRVEGKIEIAPFGKKVNVASDKTIVGVGADAAILRGGFRLLGVKNVIVRNLTIRDGFVEGDWDGKTNDHDAIQIDDSHHVWIDHCHLTRMGDGLIDLRKTTDYVTVSWCVLSDHNKAFGIGWTPSADRLRITIHHTWIRGTFQRNPSFDNGTGHLYNNYLQDIKGYGNYARGRAKLVVENSVFENVRNPLQRDATAELVARGNRLTTTAGRDEPRGAAFDPAALYPYSLDPTDRVPELLKAKAGPQPDIGVTSP